MTKEERKAPEIVGADYCKFYFYNGYNDMMLCEVGSYKCVPGYSYGPVVRKQNIFHFILSGHGKLIINDTKYSLGPNQGFLIPDEVLAYYEADMEDPWNYVWIHVDGPKANEAFQQAGITKKQPIFIPSGAPEPLIQLFYDIISHPDEEYYGMAKSYEILNYIVTHSTNKVRAETNRQLDYVRKIIKFVQLRYNEQLKIEDIARICGLNRSYLARLFKEATGRTIQDYILTCRMNEAKQYLSSKEYPVQYIAYAVGYNDTFTFSKAFKRFTGMSPSEFRQNAEAGAPFRARNP